MSIYNSNLAGLCEDILMSSAQLQGQNSTFSLGKMNGALDFILSPVNVQNSGVEVMSLSDPSGKLKTARVVYKQQGDASLIATGVTAENRTVCDAGTEPEPKEEFVKIDDAIATPVLNFTNSKLKEYCEEKGSFMNSFLNEYLRIARETLSQQVLTKIDAGSGVNYEADGTTTAAGVSKGVTLLDASGNPVYVGLNEIIMDYENNNLNGIPAVIGQGNFDAFFRLQNLVCCNSTTPFVQAVDDSGVAYFKDHHANSVLGSNEILVVAPGATRFIGYTENTHINRNDEGGDSYHITIPDPVYGNSLMWDLDFSWDKCTKTWEWLAKTYYTVYNTFQADAFPSGSPLGDRNGMTGIFKYTANRAV